MRCSQVAIFVLLAQQMCGLSNERFRQQYLVTAYIFCTLFITNLSMKIASRAIPTLNSGVYLRRSSGPHSAEALIAFLR